VPETLTKGANLWEVNDSDYAQKRNQMENKEHQLYISYLIAF
jgi:hypothetical protein